jgi:hypothetical protein
MFHIQMFLNLGNIFRITSLKSDDLQGRRFAAQPKWRLLIRILAFGRILGNMLISVV